MAVHVFGVFELVSWKFLGFVELYFDESNASDEQQPTIAGVIAIHRTGHSDCSSIV